MAKSLRYYILPYRAASAGAKALAQALATPTVPGGPPRAFRMRLQGSSFHPAPHRKVINWGNSGGFPSPVGEDILNGNANRMQRAGNKLYWFEYIDGKSSGEIPRQPEFTTDKAVAQSWLLTNDVVCRTILNGHSGAGIIIRERLTEGDLPDAQLYVKYIPKDSEYRIHLFRTGLGEPGAVIDVQKKVRDPSKEPTTWKVRSHQNGFMFIRNGFNVPGDVTEQARRAFAVSGLDFAGVDVVWNKKQGKAYVLELNTACGLEGETVNIYANAIRRYFGESCEEKD